MAQWVKETWGKTDGKVLEKLAFFPFVPSKAREARRGPRRTSTRMPKGCARGRGCRCGRG